DAEAVDVEEQDRERVAVALAVGERASRVALERRALRRAGAGTALVAREPAAAFEGDRYVPAVGARRGERLDGERPFGERQPRRPPSGDGAGARARLGRGAP